MNPPLPCAPGGLLERSGSREALGHFAPQKGFFRRSSGGLEVPTGAGHFKMVEAAPRQALGGSEGLGARSPAGNILASRGASTKMRTSPKVPPRSPRPPQGAPPPKHFKTPDAPRTPQTPPQPRDAPGARGGGGHILQAATLLPRALRSPLQRGPVPSPPPALVPRPLPR